jgi:hypothetical protein
MGVCGIESRIAAGICPMLMEYMAMVLALAVVTDVVDVFADFDIEP